MSEPSWKQIPPALIKPSVDRSLGQPLDCGIMSDPELELLSYVYMPDSQAYRLCIVYAYANYEIISACALKLLTLKVIDQAAVANLSHVFAFYPGEPQI